MMTIHSFNALSEKAKDVARNNYRNAIQLDPPWENLYVRSSKSITNFCQQFTKMDDLRKYAKLLHGCPWTGHHWDIVAIEGLLIACNSDDITSNEQVVANVMLYMHEHRKEEIQSMQSDYQIDEALTTSELDFYEDGTLTKDHV